MSRDSFATAKYAHKSALVPLRFVSELSTEFFTTLESGKVRLRRLHIMCDRIRAQSRNDTSFKAMFGVMTVLINLEKTPGLNTSRESR